MPINEVVLPEGMQVDTVLPVEQRTHAWALLHGMRELAEEPGSGGIAESLNTAGGFISVAQSEPFNFKPAFITAALASIKAEEDEIAEALQSLGARVEIRNFANFATDKMFEIAQSTFPDRIVKKKKVYKSVKVGSHHRSYLSRVDILSFEGSFCFVKHGRQCLLSIWYPSKKLDQKKLHFDFHKCSETLIACAPKLSRLIDRILPEGMKDRVDVDF